MELGAFDSTRWLFWSDDAISAKVAKLLEWRFSEDKSFFPTLSAEDVDGFWSPIANEVAENELDAGGDTFEMLDVASTLAAAEVLNAGAQFDDGGKSESSPRDEPLADIRLEGGPIKVFI